MDELQVHTLADAYKNNRAELVYIKDGNLHFVKRNYEIEMTCIRGRADIIKWTHHLMGKSWMTIEILEQFLQLTCAYRDIPIYGKD